MLNIIDLCKSYGNHKVFENLSLNVKPNDCIGILGPNGIGKSTLVGCICGVTKYNSGKILIDGKLINRNIFRSKRLIGVCFQDTIYDRFFNIRDSLRIYAMYHGINRKRAKKRADEVLEILKLTKYAKYTGDKISGGMKKRYQIAMATIHDPDLLILDEPTAGVDIELKQNLFEIIKSFLMKSSRKTIILITHNINEIKRICNRIVLIKKDGIAVDRTLNEVNFTKGNYLENLYNKVYLQNNEDCIKSANKRNRRRIGERSS